jgi:hypothetical protein
LSGGTDPEPEPDVAPLPEVSLPLPDEVSLPLPVLELPPELLLLPDEHVSVSELELSELEESVSVSESEIVVVPDPVLPPDELVLLPELVQLSELELVLLPPGTEPEPDPLLTSLPLSDPPLLELVELEPELFDVDVLFDDELEFDPVSLSEVEVLDVLFPDELDALLDDELVLLPPVDEVELPVDEVLFPAEVVPPAPSTPTTYPVLSSMIVSVQPV